MNSILNPISETVFAEKGPEVTAMRSADYLDNIWSGLQSSASTWIDE